MNDIIVNGDGVYRWDGGAGVWRRIPDVETANAMGVDWSALDTAESAPDPNGTPWLSVNAPAPGTAATDPATGLPSGITTGDYGGAVDVSSLSMTPAGQAQLAQLGIEPQDVPQLPPTGYDPNYSPGGSAPSSAVSGGYDDDIQLISYVIINRDANGSPQIAGSHNGQPTVQSTWRGLLDTFAHGLPGYAAATRSVSGRLLGRVN